MIKLHDGEAVINAYKKSASTAFALGDVVTRDSSGHLAKATATTPRSQILGLIQRDVLSTDPDYALNSLVPVQEFDEDSVFEATVDTGTAVQAMVGKTFDLNDHNGINVNSRLQKCFKITKIVSTTSVLGKIVTDGDGFEMVSYQQDVSVADFTDGGSTVGTLDLSVLIPAGAVFARALVTNIIGFAGDSSAVMTIGDGTDVDRYNTGTPDVFSTAVAGVDFGAPSGTLFHSAVKTPKLTVTTGADFTSCKSNGSGRATVTLFWYQAS